MNKAKSKVNYSIETLLRVLEIQAVKIISNTLFNLLIHKSFSILLKL